MPQTVVRQCLSCRTYQCESPQNTNPPFECKMCHSHEPIQQEWFRGSGKECRMYCQRANQRMMENSNDCVMVDESPRDRMNCSIKSELGDSLSQSFASDLNATPGSPLMEIVEDQDMVDSPPESKRKYGLAVTPQKDDREHKRPRAGPLQSPNVLDIRPHSKYSSLDYRSEENCGFGGP